MEFYNSCVELIIAMSLKIDAHMNVLPIELDVLALMVKKIIIHITHKKQILFLSENQ